MEAGWDRVQPFVRLSNAEIEAMLEPLLGAAVRVDRAEPLTAGLANTNYRVAVRGRAEPVVLRLHTRDPAACVTEVAVRRLVADSVPVPGTLYADTDGKRFGHPYIVTTWVEAALMRELLASAAASEQRSLGYAAGACLVRISAHRFEQAGFFAPDGSLTPRGGLPPFVAYIEDCLFSRGGAANLGNALALQVHEFLKQHADCLPGGDSLAVLGHGDYKASNLLAQRTAAGHEIAAVLDWEFSFAGPSQFDLAILLRYSDQMPAFEEGVVEGYRAAGGRLPSGWKQAVRLLDFANLCGFVTGEDRSRARIEDVKALLSQTMARWSSYA